MEPLKLNRIMHVVNIHAQIPVDQARITRNLRIDLKKVSTSPDSRNVLGEIDSNTKSNKRSDVSFIGENLREPLECLNSCRKKFVKSGHLVKHMQLVHKSPVKFINPVLRDPHLKVKNLCDLCQQSFATPASLRRHIKLHDMVFVKSEHHSPSKLDGCFSCTECGKKYVAKPSLKRHILTEHRGFKSTCNLCGLSFARLDNHMALVHEDNLSPCPICSKLVAPPGLARHIRTVHMGCLVRCVECDRFVSNIHKHMLGSHPMACQAKDDHSDHLNCDCVFYLGPSKFFPIKKEDTVP